MALDWVAVVRAVEGYYPKAKGAVSNQDEELRSNLTIYGNGILDEISRKKRWSLAWTTYSFTTTSPTASYALPAGQFVTVPGMTTLAMAYYLDVNGGYKTLELVDAHELRRVYGDGVNAKTGTPRRYAIEGNNIHLFPAPDTNGPSGGAYPIILIYFSKLVPLIETVATVNNSATVVIPDGNYVLAEGGYVSGASVSIRGAGFAQSATAFGDYVGAWSTLGGVNFVAAPIVPGNVTAAPCYFFSQNWLLTGFRKLVTFGVCREVATYLGSVQSAAVWDQRYQQEIQDLEAFDADRQTDRETLAGAVLGQNRPLLRELDTASIFDVRGG